MSGRYRSCVIKKGESLIPTITGNNGEQRFVFNTFERRCDACRFTENAETRLTFWESTAMFRTGPSLWNREYCEMMKTPSLVCRTFRTLPCSAETKHTNVSGRCCGPPHKNALHLSSGILCSPPTTFFLQSASEAQRSDLDGFHLLWWFDLWSQNWIQQSSAQGDIEDRSSSDAPVSREGLNAVLLVLICVCHAGTFHPHSLFLPVRDSSESNLKKPLFNCTLAAKVVFIRIFWHIQTVAAGVPVKSSLKCGSQGGRRQFCWVRVSPG